MSSSASCSPGWCRTRQLGVADPLAFALNSAGLPASAGSSRSAPRSRCRPCCSCSSTASRGSSSRWRATACCRSGPRASIAKTRIPYMTTLITGVVVALASAVGDAAETYDLTNIGTLFAFALVCVGVLVLRVKEPNRPRPFKVPFVWLVAPLGAAACIFIMQGSAEPGLDAIRLVAAHRDRAVLRVRISEQQAEEKLGSTAQGQTALRFEVGRSIDSPSMSFPLTGVRVLDLTRLVPGAFATLMLAELGAEVIKIEDPRGGDPMRHFPPLLDGRGVYDLLLNRGKKSVALDLRTPGNAATLDRSWPGRTSSSKVSGRRRRSGSASRRSSCCGRHPRLIHCSITGYGQTGPYAERPGHDLNYVALSGVLGPRSAGADDAAEDVYRGCRRRRDERGDRRSWRRCSAASARGRARRSICRCTKPRCTG